MRKALRFGLILGVVALFAIVCMPAKAEFADLAPACEYTPLDQRINCCSEHADDVWWDVVLACMARPGHGAQECRWEADDAERDAEIDCRQRLPVRPHVDVKSTRITKPADSTPTTRR